MLWLIQALVLVLVAPLLMLSEGDWVYHFEQYQVVRNLMANPIEMPKVYDLIVELLRFAAKP